MAPSLEHVLHEMTYLNYRLANVGAPEATQAVPGMVWHQDATPKAIRYQDGTLILDGEWHQGELQKIVVSMLALEMEKVSLHPFHSSAIRYRDRTILFLGGEENHGKSMSQIEGSRRGGLVVSTETTVTDDWGWVVMGSKSVFLRTRAKGTERADKPDQDRRGQVLLLRCPNSPTLSIPASICDHAAIDGHYDTLVASSTSLKEYQTYAGDELSGPASNPGTGTAHADHRHGRAWPERTCHRFVRGPAIWCARNPQGSWRGQLLKA
jgi:hypothetical protein